MLSHFSADPHETLDHRWGKAYETLGEDVQGRNPHLVVVEIGGSQTGLDVIVCATGEHTGRAGEAPTIGVFCYALGEFAGGRERIQADSDAST